MAIIATAAPLARADLAALAAGHQRFRQHQPRQETEVATPVAVVVSSADLPWAPAALFDTAPGAIYHLSTATGLLSEPLTLAAVEAAIGRLRIDTVLLIGLSGDLDSARRLTEDAVTGIALCAALRRPDLSVAVAVCDATGALTFGPALPPAGGHDTADALERVVASTVSVEATAGPERRRSGAGLVIDPAAGTVVTAEHVVHGLERFEIAFADGARRSADLVGSDPGADVAVLRTSALDLPAVTLGRTAPLRLGERLFAVGNPFDRFFGSVTAGVVSALGRRFESEGRSYECLIQTDAPMNRGNSGGPLVDAAGRVVGLSVAIFSTTQTHAGVGFAVPIDQVLAAGRGLLEHGELPWLGALVSDLPPEAARRLRRTVASGAAVTGVVAPSPALDGGLREWDIIEQVGEQPVSGVADLRRIVWAARVGASVRLAVWRAGERRELEVVLGRRRPEVTAGM